MKLKVAGLPIFVIFVVAIATSGCSSSHLKANMTQIKEMYNSIHSMSGTAVLKEGNLNDTVIFTFVKPNKILIWYSTKNKMIVYNGSSGLITSGGKVKKFKEKPFNPFDYGEIINNGKAYVSGNNIIVENSLGKVWLNEKLLPVKIEWKKGVFVKIVNISINGLGDEKIISDLMGGKHKEKANRLVSIGEAEKMVNFSLIVPKYTAGCKFIGAIVSKDIVTLYYGNENSKSLFTVVEAKNISYLENTCGMIVKSKIELNGITVKVGKALGKWDACGFEKDGIGVIVYGNVGSEEIIKIVRSII